MNDTLDLAFNPDVSNPYQTHISVSTRAVVAAVSCAVAVIGVFANLMNIVVFRCQGFQDTVNISLFALALSDLCSLVSIFLYSTVVLCELREESTLPRSFSYPSGWLLYAFSFCSCWIAVFISVERCLCVALPLKVKDIITPKVTVVCLTVIACVTLGSIMPALWCVKFSVFQTAENTTYVGIDFTEDRFILEYITYAFVTFLQIGSFVCLLTSTMILIVALRRKVKKRIQQLSAASSGQSGRVDSMTKEDRVVKMVIVVSVIILVSFSPGQTVSLLTIFRPQFDFGREEEWLSRMAWASAIFFYTINASVNVIIYFRMSSKFRATMLDIVQKTTGCFDTETDRTKPGVHPPITNLRSAKCSIP